MMFPKLKLLITIFMIMKAMANTVVNTKTEEMEELFIDLNASSLSVSKVKWGLKMIMDPPNIIQIVI
jgi:hypothetical protein